MRALDDLPLELIGETIARTSVADFVGANMDMPAEDKQRLLRAMATTVSHGGEIVPAEVELLRVVSASLHVPLAVLEQDWESPARIPVHDTTALDS